MRCLSHGAAALSTRAPNAAKYTLYLLFIHRERFLRVYSLKWMCAPLAVEFLAPFRYENARACINTRHFVDVSIKFRPL